MKIFIMTLLFSFCISSAYGVKNSTSLKALNSLGELEWEHRIILVINNNNSANAFSQSQAEIDDRHVIWFAIENNTLETNYSKPVTDRLLGSIKEQYFDQQYRDKRHPDKQYKVILIGKDGGIKLRQSTLDLQKLFDRIDAMPMRIQEMGGYAW